MGPFNVNMFTSKKYEKIGFTLLAQRNSHKAFDADKDGFTDMPELEKFNFNPKLVFYISDKTNLSSIIKLADYYQLNNNEQLTIKYLKLAKNISPQEIYFRLYNYYESMNNINKMIKYLILGSEIGDYNSSYLLGQYYEKHKQYILMKNLYKLSIKQCKYGVCKIRGRMALANYYESINNINKMQ